MNNCNLCTWQAEHMHIHTLMLHAPPDVCISSSSAALFSPILCRAYAKILLQNPAATCRLWLKSRLPVVCGVAPTLLVSRGFETAFSEKQDAILCQLQKA